MSKLSFLVFLLALSLSYAQSPVPEDAELELLATGFQQPEGPVWNDSLGLLFSDIRANLIYKWSPEDSSVTPYLQPSDSSNGLTFDQQGRLILTQMLLRRVARREFDGTITPLASTYRGKKFNSPNDLVVKSDGAIFFTDPTFNIPQGQHQELPYAGIYRIDTMGIVTLLDSTLNLPNGICFSPDETKLYVNNSQARVIYVWDVMGDSTVANKREFARINPFGYADGMKVDSVGNLFCTGPQGVWIFSPEGTLLDTIVVPGNASNCNWGDEDRKTLYITGGNSIYRIRLAKATTTDIKDHGSIPANFKLYQNFPNPFNPITTISYQLLVAGDVKLLIYNLIGQKIKTLLDSFQNPGEHSIVWSGMNDNRNFVPSGIYFYRIETNGMGFQKKMILIK